MDDIHFHVSGDVSINIVLPDIAGGAGDTASYQRLVDSLGEYLHDAADEEVTPEAEVDSIVMVMRPDKTPEVMLETECWDEVESRGKRTAQAGARRKGNGPLKRGRGRGVYLPLPLALLNFK